MNGLNSVGGFNQAANTSAASPGSANGSSFEEAFIDQSVTTGAVLMQFIGADILESIMKGEDAVD